LVRAARIEAFFSGSAFWLILARRSLEALLSAGGFALDRLSIAGADSTVDATESAHIVTARQMIAGIQVEDEDFQRTNTQSWQRDHEAL
jgi:hypothetical protein